MSRTHTSIKTKYHRKIAGSNNDPCVFCGRDAYTIDHIVPRSQGGTNDINNLAPMCSKCNNDKADSSILMAFFHPRLKRRMAIQNATRRNQQKRNAHQYRVENEWREKQKSAQ